VHVLLIAYTSVEELVGHGISLRCLLYQNGSSYWSIGISHPLRVGYGVEPNTFIVVDQQCLSKPVRDVLREVPYRYKATKLVLCFLTSARLVIVAAVSRLVR
jgi:hypothetical protein